MDGSDHDYAFFTGKLGMLFNIHDSKLTVVGLDSHMYGQSAHAVYDSVNIIEESSHESHHNNAREGSKFDETSIDVDAQNSVGISLEQKEISDTSLVRQQPSADTNSRELTAAEAEFLSAMANFDDNDNANEFIDVKNQQNSDHTPPDSDHTQVAIAAPADMPGSSIDFKAAFANHEVLFFE